MDQRSIEQWELACQRSLAHSEQRRESRRNSWPRRLESLGLIVLIGAVLAGLFIALAYLPA